MMNLENITIIKNIEKMCELYQDSSNSYSTYFYKWKLWDNPIEVNDDEIYFSEFAESEIFQKILSKPIDQLWKCIMINDEYIGNEEFITRYVDSVLNNKVTGDLDDELRGTIKKYASSMKVHFENYKDLVKYLNWISVDINDNKHIEDIKKFEKLFDNEKYELFGRTYSFEWSNGSIYYFREIWKPESLQGWKFSISIDLN